LSEGRAARLRRLAAIVFFGIVVIYGARHFTAITQAPQFQIHSDDTILLYRFAHWPRPVSPEDRYDYVHGLDHPALDRWVLGALLRIAGRMPATVPPEWDFTQSFEWNVEHGRVGPPATVQFVRAANAALMTIAAALMCLALMRAVTPAAGLVAGLFFIVHPSAMEVLWSLGPDALLWPLVAATLYLWVQFGATRAGAIAVGIAAGLATSTKLNGAVTVVAFCAWLLLKRRWRLAVLAGAVAFAVFVAVNPFLWSRGVLGVPKMFAEIISWRMERAALMAAHHPTYQNAPQMVRFFWLMGSWWPTLFLVLVSRRLWRLEPAVFWAASLAVLHGLTVNIPEKRYLYLIDAGLVLGIIAGYWPRRMAWPAYWRRVARRVAR
jgi:hypothetical protein